ncbi:MAG: hypothetical protein ACREC9_00170 [Methylocella sp.]
MPNTFDMIVPKMLIALSYVAFDLCRAHVQRHALNAAQQCDVAMARSRYAEAATHFAEAAAKVPAGHEDER